MEKVIFFESNGGWLHRCIFAGLDNNGSPQWVMLDQGDVMMTLQDYMEINLMKKEEMRVLCLDGEKLESATMALLLGAVLQCYPPALEKALAEAIVNLQSMGFRWKQERLQLDVHVYEYHEDVNHKTEYRFYIGCQGYRVVLEMDNFLSMEELMGTLRCYFEALETEAGIGLRKDLWFPQNDLLKQLDDENKKMFDNIY